MSAPQHRPGVSAAVDELCDRFEDALRAGQRPVIDVWLIEAGSKAPDTLPELVALELDHRIRAGQSAAATEYFTRFPRLLADLAVAVRLVAVEFRAAKDRDPQLSEAEFRRRYPDLAKLPDWSHGPWGCGSDAGTGSFHAAPADTPDELRAAKAEPIEFLKTILTAPQRPGDLGRLGDYHICDVLGVGGMGVVLAAEDPTLRRPVAIKLMRPEVAAKPGAKERFLREARSAAAVEHSRVVVIHHVGEWNGTPFLVMPLMAGRSLATRLKDGPPICMADAVRFAREAADGLAAAHAKKLIHRDIKPGNIWLEDTAEGTHVRLLDFGLARGDDSELLSRPGAVVGTPNYMAPEQAAGKSVDGRSDLFSLGCVLYELLTGRRAFSGPTLMAVLSSLANHHPAAPGDSVSSVPAALSDLSLRLLEKVASHRPSSAALVSAELRLIERHLANISETVSMNVRQPTLIWSLLRNWVWTSSGVILIGGVGLIGWVLTHDRNPRPSINSSNVMTAPGPPTAPMPLRVTAIEVNHFASTPLGDEPKGLLGQKTFTALLGDRVQVIATLSKPGYAYLIAFRPDGAADLCFPESEDTPPPLTDTPRYPLTDGQKAYGLREGTGLWVFAVVASERPLPAYRKWLQERFDNTSVWEPVPKLPAGIVWWDDGLTNVDHFTASGVSPILRGKDELLEGPAATIKRLTDSLRTSGQADASSAIGFRVAPRD